MLRSLFISLASLLLVSPCFAADAAPAGQGQAAKQESASATDATNVFPGLPLMPAGSVVNHIVLPRYEDGRVVSLIKIATLKVETVSMLSADDLVAALYDQSGNMTKITTLKAYIDFACELVSSEGLITMEDPRFRVRGQQLHFDTLRKIGVLRGPVRTVIPASQNYSQR